jgi:hypothetical protein
VSLERYRLREPTMALFDEDGRRVARTVPAGTTFTVEGDTIDGKRLVSVLWNGTRVMMFIQDVRSRAELVEGHSA